MLKKKNIFKLTLSFAAIVGIIVCTLSASYMSGDDDSTDGTVNSYLTVNQNDGIQDVSESDPNTNNTFTMEYTMNLSSTVDYSNIDDLKELAENIVIAKVTHIEGGINYSEGLGLYTSNNTIGQIEILKVFKGDLNASDIVPFIRCGGTVKTTEYIKALNEKRLYLLEEAQKNGQKTMLDYEYVKEIEEGDIEIEEGKTYLMFICYDPYNQRYEIFAQQYGLREYDIQTETVINNVTNEKENINNLNLN